MPQKAALQAIVEGQGVDDPSQRSTLQACADEAVEQINVRLLAAQPSEGNSLFKKIFLQCVDTQQIPVQVYVVALKIDDRCQPDQSSRQ